MAKVEQYYRERLNNKEAKDVYDSILKRIERQLSRISVPTGLSGNEHFDSIIYAMELDHPELFYVDFYDSRMNELYVPESGRYWVIYPSYTMSPEQRENTAGELECTKRRFSGESICGDREMSPASPWDLYEWLQKSCEPWDDRSSCPEAATVAGALLFRKATCEGYAKAFKYLFDRMYTGPEECIVVTGDLLDVDEGEESGHAWNVILSENGKRWHCDITCRPGSDYFMIPEEKMLRDREMDINFEDKAYTHHQSELPAKAGEVPRTAASGLNITINGAVYINGSININY